MAKKRTKKRVARRRALATPACRLSEVPETPDFEAAVGTTVTIVTKDHVGAVLIIKAEYGGEALVPPNQAVSNIRFKVLSGRKTLKLVCVFEASIAGRGELREDCGGDHSQFLRALAGDEPLQIIRIVGKA